MPVNHANKGARGLSLIETLVSLSILGVVMIPMLFMSSAYFTSQLAKSRTNVNIGHNVSQYTNRLIEELGQASRILRGSNATNLYFAYFDPLKQREMRVGYRLASSGGSRYLQRVVYDTSTMSWDVMSPYGSDDTMKIKLPSTAGFQYCIDSATPTCTAAAGTNPAEALMVRLSGWSFSTGTENLTLPELDIWVSAAVSDDELLFSEMPQQIYSIPASSFTATGTNLALTYLSNNRQTISTMKILTYGNGGVLSTILPSDETNPGELSTGVASDGRVFFGENSAAGRVWTWIDDGSAAGVLSTILPTDEGNPGVDSLKVSGYDGRVFFGESGSGRYWTWKNDASGGKLSTILPADETSPGSGSSLVVTDDGRAYFGENSATGRLWTWKDNGGNGRLSTILPADELQPGYFSGNYSFSSFTLASSLFFGEVGLGRFWVYTAPQQPFFTGQGTLTTILPTDESSPGLNSTTTYISGLSSPTVYFGEDNVAGHFWTWNNGTLTTILPAPESQPGYFSSAVNFDAFLSPRVFFGETGTGRFWTWRSGTLTTILPADESSPGFHSTVAGSTPDSVFFGEDSSTGRFWYWVKPAFFGARLSTLLPADESQPGYYSTAVSPDGRVYFGETGSGRFWCWTDTGGAGRLSTLLPADVVSPGFKSVAVAPDGRVFFGSSTNVWTWKDDGAGGKLSTILPAAETNPGQNSMAVAPDGRVFFGETATGRFWTWKEKMDIDADLYGLNTGSAGKGRKTLIAIPPSTPSYVSAVQDDSGTLFFVDNANKKVDAFTYNYSTSKYTNTSSFNWSAGATTVTAAAIDETSAGIYLLDRGNRQVDFYTSRLATGSPSPASFFSISAQTTQPTGLAVSNRTGNILVLDSNTYNSGGETYVELEVYSSAGSYQKSIPIMVSRDAAGSNLSVNASSETNFKILFDERQNVLYLIAPNVGSGYIFALAMPEYL